MWAWIAATGNSGIGACPVCVDVMTCPFGIFTQTGWVAIFRLLSGVLITKKCPVVPESGMALIFGGV